MADCSEVEIIWSVLGGDETALRNKTIHRRQGFGASGVEKLNRPLRMRASKSLRELFNINGLWAATRPEIRRYSSRR